MSRTTPELDDDFVDIAPPSSLLKKPRGQVFYNYAPSVGTELTIKLKDPNKRSLIAEMPPKLLFFITIFLDMKTVIFGWSLISRNVFFYCRNSDPYLQLESLYQSRLFRYEPDVDIVRCGLGDWKLTRRMQVFGSMIGMREPLNCYYSLSGRKTITSSFVLIS